MLGEGRGKGERRGREAGREEEKSKRKGIDRVGQFGEGEAKTKKKDTQHMVIFQ